LAGTSSESMGLSTTASFGYLAEKNRDPLFSGHGVYTRLKQI